jgi:hypothetical protein
MVNDQCYPRTVLVRATALHHIRVRVIALSVRGAICTARMQYCNTVGLDVHGHVTVTADGYVDIKTESLRYVL